MQISRISESEFARIVTGVAEDRESIIKHNPIGTPEETLLWMLLSSLVVYLSLEEIETPCFPGKSDAKAYREAIRFILAWCDVLSNANRTPTLYGSNTD